MGRSLTLAVALCVGAASGHARVIRVDADATGANDGSSWTDAYTDLQDALTDVSLSSGDEIWVAEGTYRPTDTGDRTISFTLVDGVGLYGGFAGTEGSRDERDWTVHETILTGDLNGDDVGFTNNGENSRHVVIGSPRAIIDGFTITHGNADGALLTNEVLGGGMLNDWRDMGGMMEDLAIRNCTFRANSADIQGGGMNNRFAPVEITSCKFEGNTSTYGGGVYGIRSSALLTNCVFNGNVAVEKGGGLRNLDSSPTLVNCTFVVNSAGTAGAGMASVSSLSIVRLYGCIFWDDDAGGIGELYDETDAQTIGSYCCVRGGWPGEGNIDSDPLFVDPDGPDDVPGTPDDDLRPSVGSPCIDSADGDAAPELDIESNPRDDDPDTPNTGVGTPDCVDMGAYEFQSGNPWSPSPPPAADDSGCAPGAPAGAAIPFALLALLALLLCRATGSDFETA